MSEQRFDAAAIGGFPAVKVGKFPFPVLGRSLSVDDTDGFVTATADALGEPTHQINR